MIDLPQPYALLFIVSGPAGSGKTTLCDRMLEEFPATINRVITATTRKPRSGEEHGVDYFFLTTEAFEAKIANNEFYEYARVHGNYYGTLKTQVLEAIRDNKTDLLLNIDVQGAATFRQIAAEDRRLDSHLVTIFIMPPSADELRQRLDNRGKDALDEIEKRLQVAESEVESWNQYNYCIQSKSKEQDFLVLKSIYLAEKAKVRL